MSKESFTTLRPVPAKAPMCDQCLRHHNDTTPHCWGEEAYMQHFFMLHSRMPTWGDAMADLNEADRARWKLRLRTVGVPEVEMEPSKPEPIA